MENLHYIILPNIFYSFNLTGYQSISFGKLFPYRDTDCNKSSKLKFSTLHIGATDARFPRPRCDYSPPPSKKKFFLVAALTDVPLFEN